jgi:hypothetical protein
MVHEHEEHNLDTKDPPRPPRLGEIRKLPSGRGQASYIGRDNHRHTAPTTYSSRLAAEGWLSTERRLYEDADAWTRPRTPFNARWAVAVAWAVP